MLRFADLGWTFLLIMAAWELPRLAARAPALATDNKPGSKPPGLIELAKLYRDLDLPLPPQEAFFAISGYFDHPLVDLPSMVEGHYQLHLATGGPYPTAKYRVWRGFKETSTRKLEIIFSRPPRPETVLRSLKLEPVHGSIDRVEGPYAELAIAIQCHLLQHFELAKFFYGRVQKSTDEPPDQILVILAWNHWAEELTNPQRDLAEVARKLHQLADKHHFFEVLANLAGEDSEISRKKSQQHQDLLDRLDLTVKQIPAKAGSIESVIDELTVDRQSSFAWKPIDETDEPDEDETADQEHHKNQKQTERPTDTDSESKLRTLGFAAIPLLIEHVDDQRLVRRPLAPWQKIYKQDDPCRVETLHSKNFPSVGSRVRGILSAFFDLDQHEATKADYQNSWKEFKVMTEADFVSKRMNTIETLSLEFTKLLTEKYQEKSLHVYETILSKEIDFRHCNILLTSIVRSDIPKATKIDLIARGARSLPVDQKCEPLRMLLELDNPAFTPACVATLEKLAWKGDGGSNDFHCVAIVALAFRTEDRKARGLIEGYFKGLPLNIKLAVLKHWSYERVPRPITPETLSFLCQFLNDTTIYEDSKKEKSGFTNLDEPFSEMEVRNFVGIQILKAMGIVIRASIRTRESQWLRIREFAKDEVDRRLENKKRQ